MTDAALRELSEVDALIIVRDAGLIEPMTAPQIARVRALVEAGYRAGAARAVGIPQDKLDAERYRWLRYFVDRRDELDALKMPDVFTPEDLDAAIDAAREQPQQQNTEAYTSGGNPSGPTDTERP